MLAALTDDMYRVRILKDKTRQGQEKEVAGKDLSRPRFLVSKQNLKNYIREVARHDVHGVSPWLIRVHLLLRISYLNVFRRIWPRNTIFQR